MTEPSSPQAYSLPPSLNHDAARGLAEFLAARRGSPVVIDAAASGQVGAQIAQILAVAARSWDADRVDFRIDDPSGRISDSLKPLGLTETFSNVVTAERSDA